MSPVSVLSDGPEHRWERHPPDLPPLLYADPDACATAGRAAQPDGAEQQLWYGDCRAEMRGLTKGNTRLAQASLCHVIM